MPRSREMYMAELKRPATAMVLPSADIAARYHWPVTGVPLMTILRGVQVLPEVVETWTSPSSLAATMTAPEAELAMARHPRTSAVVDPCAVAAAQLVPPVV